MTARPCGFYGLITADPAWKYRDATKSGKRGAGFKYGQLTTAQIARLDVRALAARDCALLLWAVPPMLGDALYVMREWGFRFSTIAFVWVKTAPETGLKRARAAIRSRLFPENGSAVRRLLSDLQEHDALNHGLAWGMGQSTRANVELVLLGVRGKLGRVSAGVHQVILAPPGRHSEKPREMQRRAVQLLGDRKRIELFARERFEGYDAWGNDPGLGAPDVELRDRPPPKPRRLKPDELPQVVSEPDPRQLNLLELCRG